jgi:hypothetical protein
MIVSHKRQSKRMLSFSSIYDYVCNKLTSASKTKEEDSFPEIEQEKPNEITFEKCNEYLKEVLDMRVWFKKGNSLDYEIAGVYEELDKLEMLCLKNIMEYFGLTEEQRVRYKELIEGNSQ